MNMNPVSFKGISGSEMYVGRNAGLAMVNLLEKNPNIKGKEDACNDIFGHGLTVGVTTFAKSDIPVDKEDCDEAKIQKEWLQELIDKNKAKPFLPDSIIRLFDRLITLIDNKMKQIK